MKILIAVTCLLEIGLLLALPYKKHKLELLKRKSRSTDDFIPCTHMVSSPGEYWYQSPGSNDVCGLYLIGQPEQLIEIQFTQFDISCETGGLLAVFDGWELNNQYFPGVEDHSLPMIERYRTFCGEEAPKTLYISSQNVALIQFRIPQAGEGFKVKVGFGINPQPCNVMAMTTEGVFTMKNFGLQRNCTVSIINPVKIKMVNVDVSVSGERTSIKRETGLTNKCTDFGGGDYVQLLDGSGLDPAYMETEAVFCGQESSTDKTFDVVLGCQNSVVRMVSSGKFYNSLTFIFWPLSQHDIYDSGVPGHC
ncbi:hypothetical protein CHS0354_011795 [Potamilus streckersoni]|uniref:Corticotropin-releasing factor-binding protein n=1 Tax=Potamilus streckersoni TaxID=2493646 RepID=A0AAE0WCT6_9BIVA|nr:hypothetical protein CHS0354_011795 [Potamilus streckersoni]